MNAIIPKADFQINATAYQFEGKNYGDIPTSFFWLFTLPGHGPGLHIHPYAEVFVLVQGQATLTIGGATTEAHDGEVTIVPPNTPHKFNNSGAAPLQMISIHPSTEVIQEWLEE